MKRMLNDEQIFELKNLLSKVSIDEDMVLIHKLTIDAELNIDPNNMINSSNEEAFFPFENNAGKVLAVNCDEDGIEAIEVSGGTKLYKHDIVQGGSGQHFVFISLDNTPIEINDDCSMNLENYNKTKSFIYPFSQDLNFYCFVTITGPSTTYKLKKLSTFPNTYSDITTAQSFTDTVTPL